MAGGGASSGSRCTYINDSEDPPPPTTTGTGTGAGTGSGTGTGPVPVVVVRYPVPVPVDRSVVDPLRDDIFCVSLSRVACAHPIHNIITVYVIVHIGVAYWNTEKIETREAANTRL